MKTPKKPKSKKLRRGTDPTVDREGLGNQQMGNDLGERLLKWL
jgi:hypothetical protein